MQISQERKELLTWNKAFLKSLQLSEIVSDLKVGLWRNKTIIFIIYERPVDCFLVFYYCFPSGILTLILSEIFWFFDMTTATINLLYPVFNFACIWCFLLDSFIVDFLQ